MYEEDRQLALDMYEKMINDAADEQSLLQYLVSPTRQAVVLARTYDTKDHRLQVHSQHKEDGEDYGEELPGFVQAIEKLQQDALSMGVVAPAVDKNQFSLFDEMEDEPAVQSANAAPAYADDSDAEADGSVDKVADAVDAFLADFAIADGTLVPREATDTQAQPEKEPAVEAEPAEAEESPAEAVEEKPVDEAFTLTESTEQESAAPVVEEPKAVGTVRKPKVFLLIVFLLFAVPITAVGLILLLVPTLLFLALAVCVVSAAILVLTAAFSGFTMFSDLMLVLGVALVLMALGLLLTWIFIWFVGGAMVGLIRGVCYLGGKWCYKEVAAE